MCELPGGVAGDENGVARTRTRVAYVRAQTRKAAPVADVRTGETTCFVEKSHLMCALALVLFLLARAPGRGQCMGLHAGKIPCKHRSAKQHRCRRSLAEKHNFLSLVVRWKVTCALALVPYTHLLYNPHYSPFSEFCHLIVGHVPTKVLQVELSMVQSLLLDMELFCQPLQLEILLSVGILPVTGLTQPPL